MFGVDVEFQCGLDSPHAGTSRNLRYSFITEQRAKEFVDKVNAKPYDVNQGPSATATYKGETK